MLRGFWFFNFALSVLTWLFFLVKIHSESYLNYVIWNDDNGLMLMNYGTYIVESENCKIPNINPFDLSQVGFIRRHTRKECYRYPALTEIVYSRDRSKTWIRINRRAIKYYSGYNNFQCCLHIIRPFDDTSGCIHFKETRRLTEYSPYILVKCSKPDGSLGYENFHAAVVKHTTVEDRGAADRSKLNVLILGLDSISRLNLYRTMPKTSTYLHTRGWVELRGYNKIGDNTLPNLMALLTGLSPYQTEISYQDYLDDYPFIWKEFSAANYVTVYAEDKFGIGTFDCHLNGFKNKPTDYCTRGFFHEGELDGYSKEKKNDCLGFKSYSDHLFDYLLDFVEVHRDNSFFGLFWENDFSHNDLNQPSSEDRHMLQVLQRLEHVGTLNNTVVVFLSDHGQRTGGSRKTDIGWYEDRLPFLFISVPSWFKDQNRSEYLNLLSNADKLTSPYDVYMTISHVLYGSNPNIPRGCKTCHSLFSAIPRNRSCSEAGISPHWCTCHKPLGIPADPYNATAIRWANMVVQAINVMLEEATDLMFGYKCETRSLGEILYLRQKVGAPLTEFVIGVQTYPQGGQFEGTIVKNGSVVTVDDAMSRLNSYDGESGCARDRTTKMFCFCVYVGDYEWTW